MLFDRRHLGRQGRQLGGADAERRGIGPGEASVRLVHQRRRLEGVSLGLVAHLTSSELSERVVQDHDELVECEILAPLSESKRNRSWEVVGASRARGGPRVGGPPILIYAPLPRSVILSSDASHGDQKKPRGSQVRP